MDPEKEKILNYSRQKFHKEGFYKTTMDELAREMQVSKKTIYKHFESKEKLVEEINSQVNYDVQNEMNIIIDAKENVVWKFVQALNYYNRFLMGISDKYRRDIQVHAPQLWYKTEKFISDFIYTNLNNLINQGKKEKLIENFPNEIILTSFVSSIHAVIDPEFILKNNFSMPQAITYAFDMLMYGILTQHGVEKYNKMKKSLNIETI